MLKISKRKAVVISMVLGGEGAVKEDGDYILL